MSKFQKSKTCDFFCWFSNTVWIVICLATSLYILWLDHDIHKWVFTTPWRTVNPQKISNKVFPFRVCSEFDVLFAELCVDDDDSFTLDSFQAKMQTLLLSRIFGTFTQLFILKKIGLDVQTFKNRKVWNISKTWKWFTLQSISFGSSWMIMKICVHFHANFIFDPTPWHVHHFDRHFVKFTSLV